MGFRMVPRDGAGFTLVGKANLRAVSYEPSNFGGTPSSRFGFSEPSLRSVIVTALPENLQDVVPLGDAATSGFSIGSVAGNIGKSQSRTFSVDVTRLPQDQLLVGSRLFFQRMVESALPPAIDRATVPDETFRAILNDLIDVGTITVPSDI